MKLFRSIINRIEYRARRDTLVQLRGMTDRTLIDCNISPELLKEGVTAWPWQNPSEEIVPLTFESLSPTITTAQTVERSYPQAVTEQSEVQEQIEASEQLDQINAA